MGKGVMRTGVLDIKRRDVVPVNRVVKVHVLRPRHTSRFSGLLDGGVRARAARYQGVGCWSGLKLGRVLRA